MRSGYFLLCTLTGVVLATGCAVSQCGEPVNGAPAPTQEERFLAEVKKAKDPVALAAAVLKGKKFAGMEFLALRVLRERWEDPQAAKVLQEISKSQPRTRRDGLKTIAGHAHDALQYVLAKNELKAMLKGKHTAVEKLAALKKAFASHPDWLLPKKRLRDKAVLVYLMIQEIVNSRLPEGAGLVVESGCLSAKELLDYVKANPKFVVAWAEKSGPKKALHFPNLVGALGASADPGATKLLTDWLQKAKNREDVDALVSALASGPTGRKQIVALLRSKREVVLKSAAGILAGYFASEESATQVEGLIRLRKAAGAQKAELDYYRRLLKQIREEVKENSGEKSK